MKGFKVGDNIRFVDDGDLIHELILCHGVVVSLYDDTETVFGEVKVLDGPLKGKKIDTHVQHAELEDENL